VEADEVAAAIALNCIAIPSPRLVTGNSAFYITLVVPVSL